MSVSSSHSPRLRCRQVLKPWLFDILAGMAATDMLRLQAVAKLSHGAIHWGIGIFPSLQ